jgi:ATP-dependent exoDNAse (exonuclease V) alpha subunit
VNAPKILAGQPIALEDCEDFEFYDCDGEPSGLGSVVGDVLERLYAGGVDTFDTVVLSPRKTAGLAGSTADLNVQLQARFNPDGVEVEVGNQKFRVGDKTLQLKNNYELGALNGDLGVLTQVAYDRGRLLGAELLLGTLTDKVVKRMRRGVVGAQAAVPQRRRSTDAFTRAEEDLAAMRLQAETPPATVPTLEEDDARFAIFSKKELYDVSLGYALTIHKSQGSEWPIVVVVCHTVHGYQMLTRKLLYTALTRASQKVVLIGDQLGITRALATIQDDRRRTGLQVRLCE